jgi:hypothetical protein
MTHFECIESILWSIAMRLCRYLSKCARDIREFDILNARISQIISGINLSFGCPQSSSPLCQVTQQSVVLSDNVVAHFGRP